MLPVALSCVFFCTEIKRAILVLVVVSGTVCLTLTASVPASVACLTDTNK